MATYTKLRNGWGVRATGDAPKIGQRVTVTKKDGGTKTETIDRVVFSNNGVHLCAIKQREAKPVSVCYSCGCEFRGWGDYCGC
jgi:hypothetical protein